MFKSNTNTQSLKEFDDLVGNDSFDPHAATEPINSDDDDNETDIHKLDANSLTLKDLLQEMERRGLQPRGFFEDDAKVLQAELDEEHDQYIETKRRERREARVLESEQAILRHRKILTETQIAEERKEIKRDKRADEWFYLIRNGTVPNHCRIDVNDITARPLARLLWTDLKIVSLNVGNMNLSDTTGAYISRALKNNRSITKLEMSENFMGSKTCQILAESLLVNNVIQFIDLGSNPLTANNIAGIEAMAAMLQHNRSLRYLSLWRCNVGVEGGRLLSAAMPFNNNLTCFELGYNSWDHSDIRKIEEKMVRQNIQIYVFESSGSTKNTESSTDI